MHSTVTHVILTARDYVFFFSYIQVAPKDGAALWSNAQEMCRVNGNLLKNFLDALALSDIKPKRFILQTGAKYYGYVSPDSADPVIFARQLGERTLILRIGAILVH